MCKLLQNDLMWNIVSAGQVVLSSSLSEEATCIWIAESSFQQISHSSAQLISDEVMLI